MIFHISSWTIRNKQFTLEAEKRIWMRFQMKNKIETTSATERKAYGEENI